MVLDTNVFLVSLAEASPYAVIFDKLIDGSFELVIHNEIIEEYEEIIGQRYDYQTVNDVLELLLHLTNVYRQDIFFRWNLIEKDADDNKFDDIYIASQADYLVTNDRHFAVLKEPHFPKINLLTAEEFIHLLYKL